MAYRGGCAKPSSDEGRRLLNWLAPAAFGWFALLGILIVIYLLRPRRQRVIVPSLMLWLEDDRGIAGSKLWRWLRRHILLILQAFALAALILSLARPERLKLTRIAPDLVVIVDGSGRFTAPTETGDRFDGARIAVREHLEGIDGTAAVSIILAANPPRIVAVRETDAGAVRKAVRELEPGYGQADIETALEIAQSILRDGPGGSIAIVSDGHFRIDNVELLANAGLIEVQSGPAELRIDRVAARREPSGVMQALVGVISTLSEPREVNVELSVGGAEFATQKINVPSNGWAGAVFSDVGATSTADISATLVDEPPGSSGADANAQRLPPITELRAAVVSNDPSSYTRALDVLPNVIVQAVDPPSYDPKARFDLYIFDRFVPETLPGASMIFFSPPIENRVFETSTEISSSLPIKARDSRLLQFVDLSFLEPGESNSISIPEWSQADLILDVGAAIFHGIFEGRRTVVASFDPVDAGMTDTAAFPIFMINAVAWANPLRALSDANGVSTGQKLHIQPHPQATEIEIAGPDGAPPSKFDAAGVVAIGPFQETGLYRLTQFASGRALGIEEFNVHSPSFGASSPQSKIELGPPPTLVSASLDTRLASSELWMWIALGALLIMSGEWLWFHRVRAAA